MKPFLVFLALLCLCPWYAFGQSKDETIDFLTSEYRAFESRGYIYTELTFAPKGDSFTLKRVKDRGKDYLVSFNLRDVEIYQVTINSANGISKHQIMVRNRGRDTGIQKDGRNYTGVLKISPAMDNEKKCEALERAFNRLIALTTGRKYL
jgi:uncharacterized protein YkuJ